MKHPLKAHKIESPMYSSFEHIVVSIKLPCQSLLLASVYRPPGSCTLTFLDEFMSFVSFVSSIDCAFYICGDFNIHIDVLGGEGEKFLNQVESCNLKQLVAHPTHLHGHILDLILSPIG